jgi:hypothetical protein
LAAAAAAVEMMALRTFRFKAEVEVVLLLASLM